MRTPIALSLALSLFSLTPAHAAQKGDAVKVTAADLHAAQRARVARLRSVATFFDKIAVQKNYQGSHVVYHDAEVTAFLDLTDPMHPHFDATRADEDEALAKLPAAKRAHVLVVPNLKREHIAESLDGVITLADVEATTRVLEAGHRIARDLKLVNPRVYINQTHQIGVGYLHVHVVGERTQPYPQVTAP